MNRKNFPTTALMGLGLAAVPRKAEGTPPAPLAGIAKKLPCDLIKTSYEGLSVVNIPAPPVAGTPKLSGASGNLLFCQCPACNGSGFIRRMHKDTEACSYCRMVGHLVTTETFGMYNAEGNAEVWRALVRHEWSQRNWKESVDGPQPWLPGMLYYIGQKHPEVYDTAVRDNIYTWLEKRFDKAHAQAQYEAWVGEIVRNIREEESAKLA